MCVAVLTFLAASGAFTFGTPGSDTPVAARVLENGTLAVVVQTYPPEGDMYYWLALVDPGNETEMARDRLRTGLEDPAWTRGCGFTSDSTFAIEVASWETSQEFTQIQFYQLTSRKPLHIFEIPSTSGTMEDSQLNVFHPLPGIEGSFLTTDIYGESENVAQKHLVRLDGEGDTLWVSDMPFQGWWMNPDVVRPMPGGGVATTSDEDGFSPILAVNRYSGGGDLLWSAEVDTEGEMLHSAHDILPAPNGGTLLVASTDMFRLNYHLLAVIFDENGEVLNETVESHEGNLQCLCGLTLPEGDFLLAGGSQPCGEGSTAMARAMAPTLVRLDSRGNVLGIEVLESPAYNAAVRIILRDGEDFLLLGSCSGNGNDYSTNLFVQEIDRTDLP
ncbi:MAG: hypothetical protein GF388_02300 [Candidatus Aegiribacteria sp.]|nr:hypothetical protein [Candidatus Aegiribacteria sp.]MBD3294151.1 hypothetical protein [Candidatus Fermentibacteria bacterium]